MSTDLPRQRKRVDARRNAARLVEVATEVFAEHGYDASLEEIARRANLGVGTLYRHFPTREALVDEVLGHVAEEFQPLMDESRELPRSVERLRIQLGIFVDYNRRFGGIAARLKETTVGHDPPLTTHAMAWKAYCTQIITDGQKDGLVRTDIDPMDVVRMLGGISMMERAHCMALSVEERDAIAERTFDIVLHGILAAPLP